MDFKQIEAFVNVVKYKGFSKAADATFITQPTISAHIRALEKELNLQLIDRTRREVVPTPEGKLFLTYAIALLNTRAAAIYSLQNFALNINGTIDIQSSGIPGCYLLPGLIAGFKSQFTHAKFNVQLSDSSEVARNIRERKGEIGFVGRRENNALSYDLLTEDKAVLIVPDDDRFGLTDGQSTTLANIVDKPFIVRENGSATLENFYSELDAKGIPSSELNIVVRVNSIDAIKETVKMGVGVSIISEIAAGRENKNRGYRIIDIEDYGQQRLFYMVYDSSVTMSPTAETFKSYVLEHYAIETG